jgi:hypothetical protein
VITRTWDSGGRDHKDVWHIKHPYVYPESGNPLMGPFYVEGAEHGDALEVHLDKLRLNRAHGYTSYHLSSGVLDGGGGSMTPATDGAVRPDERPDPWDIDLAKGTLSPRLKRNAIRLEDRDPGPSDAGVHRGRPGAAWSRPPGPRTNTEATWTTTM